MSTEQQQNSEEQEVVVQVESTLSRDATDEEGAEATGTPQGSTVMPVMIERARDKPEATRRSKDSGDTLRDRESGKSVLPFSRVQKIMKADKDLPMVAKDATFLISLATEEFIRRLSRACQKLAEREKRTTVQQRDVANIVRRVEEFLFLEEIIGSQESTGKRKPQKAKADAGVPTDQLQSTLRNFVQKPNEGAEDVNDIIVNEDGVMYAE